MNIIGIDPGKTGGIVSINDNNTIKYHFIPKIGNEVDVRKLNDIFNLYNPKEWKVVIENIHALFGVSSASTFALGHICGLLEGYIVSHEFSFIKVNPKLWQKEMFEGIPEKRKTGKVNSKTGKITKGRIDTKKMAELAYMRLFPNIDLYLTEAGNKSKNVHDGLVDAILLSEYGRRKFKGV